VIVIKRIQTDNTSAIIADDTAATYNKLTITMIISSKLIVT